MLRNFFLVTVRNLFKNKLYSFINITGLATGIVCSTLIMLWVQDELSFDGFHENKDQLHQVWIHAQYDGKINTWNSVPLPTYKAMQTAHSNIKNATATDWGQEHLLTAGDKRLYREGYFAGEEFLEMFKFPMISGDPATVLDGPTSIVLTKSLADALFENEDPIGQIVKVDNHGSLTVTGILEDIPGNSSFEFEFLLPWKYYLQSHDWVKRANSQWGNYSFQVYVELNDPTQFDETEKAIENMLAENGETDMPRTFFFHPLPDWHLYSSFENGQQTGGASDFVKLFTIIAIFILLIACINFMNLATARSEKRAREVGIRKSIGSTRYELILQFLGESLIISVISCILALVVAEVTLPYYNNLVDKELFLNYQSPTFWLSIAGIIIFTGFISGSYPAFYLSSFKPIQTLKGKISTGKGVNAPRKVLVVLQFVCAMVLMVGTIVIFQQIELSKNRELGYNQERLLTIDYNDELGDNYALIKQELLSSGLVEGVTKSNSPITGVYSNNFVDWPGKPESLKVLFATIATEYDYTNTMGIEVLQGRDFSKEFSTDSANVLINKAGLEVMGLEDPIGTKLGFWGEQMTLVGVVDNVIMRSPYSEVKPAIFIMNPSWASAMTLRLNANRDVSESLASIQNIFEKHNPSYPFEYSFVDEDYARKFRHITLTSKLATIFSVLAIMITGLGLFGLASFTAEQRTKEIGIRKVLGASVFSLVTLISKDFSKLVIISFALATPLAWYALSSYIERYPIHTEIQWWIFPLVGATALLFALIIVTNQARNAAHANPVDSLHDD